MGLIFSLELRAVFLALIHFEILVVGHSVLVRSDNVTVVAYIYPQGGTHSQSFCHLTLDLWRWCLLRHVHLVASHIPGEENLLADFLFRGRFLPSVWKLNVSVFLRLCQLLPTPPEIDLFASLLFFQLPKYCARSRDTRAW